MSLQFDHANNQLKVNDAANANAPLLLTSAGSGPVMVTGSGQNLFTYSEQFNQSIWVKSSTTVTADAVSSPTNTLTADKLVEAVSAAAEHYLEYSNANPTPSATYVYSIYVKAAERTKFGLRVVYSNGANDSHIVFDLSNPVAPAAAGIVTSTSIINVGGGWYRCAVTYTLPSSNPVTTLLTRVQMWSGVSSSYAGDGISGFYVWGAQLELSTTLGAYVQAVATRVYGTPSLSMAGVAGVSLQSDGALVVQPAGAGPLQAQPTTSTVAGGNARGVYATDLQRFRSGAGQVASNYGSVIAGGEANTASGYDASVIGGAANGATGLYTFAGGGYGNVAGGSTGGTVVNGYQNNANGFWNFIGNGAFNTGTSASAVTTQSATMNGTTAVTLAASNASIKVGQVVGGTYINTFPHTYVAAISGTSLTLSQVATGSGTATLSFYTPHGAVVAGGNNQATGSYSFIGGGGDAGTASNRNVASGDWSVVGGGIRNTANNSSSFVGGGGTYGGGNINGNTASGAASVVVGGYGNTASGFISFVGGGNANVANGQYSFIGGGAAGTTRAIQGYHAFPAHNAPINFNTGVSQNGLLILGRETTDATATRLTSDSLTTGGTTNQVILPNNAAYFFKGEVVAGVTGGGNSKGWTIEGVIKRGASAAATALVGTPTVTSLYADAGASTWTITVTADTTNGGLAITFTGQAATTIRCVAKIETTEMTF